MNTHIRYVVFSLIGISIVLTMLLGHPELSPSTAKVHGVNPTADLRPATPETVDEIVTLKPVSLKTSTRFFQWAEKHSYCGAPSHAFEVRPSEDEIPGTVVAGFQHRYDKGAIAFGCPDGDSTTYRGSVWFDLSDIMSKAPYPHLSVLSATLHFDAKYECPGALLVATEDWMKGYPDDTLVPGDPIPVNKFYGDSKPAYPTAAWPPEGVSVDVSAVVTNWLRGEENGGYANYGFVFRGYAEGDTQFKDADACVSRFSYFTLTVKYRYDKDSAKAPDTYPIICRGTDTFKVIDTVGPAGSKGVGFTFTPGTSKAKDGLRPGQCSWVDRGMRPGEPGLLAQAVGSAGEWTKELNSSDSYWTFNVYNAGEQLQATSAERISKPSTDIVKTPPGPIGGGLETRKNVALALNGATADARDFTHDGVVPGLFFRPAFAIDGVLHTTSAGGNYWRDEHGLPSYLEVDFHHLKTIDEIDVITIQVPGYETGADPSESDPKPFTSQGAENFEVQYLTTGETWERVPNGFIIGNSLAFRRIIFLPSMKTITTSKIRVYVTKSAGPAGGDGIARIVELQAWGS